MQMDCILNPHYFANGAIQYEENGRLFELFIFYKSQGQKSYLTTQINNIICIYIEHPFF